jgi:hypothetical protein
MVAAARLRRGALLLGLVAAAVSGEGRVGAEDAPAGGLSEYQIKAAYLYYFTTFVEWPSETFARNNDALVVGVLGVDPFGAMLDDALRDKVVNKRRLVVKRLGSPREARDCQILFIGASERDRLTSILSGLEGAAVLTVGDIDQFANRGGQIAFRMEGKRVRFDINAAAAERARLKISAQLLKLARVVKGPERDGG